MDLIDEDYLKPWRKDDNIAERGGPVIPEQAAEIIRQAQRMQQVESPFMIQILKKNTNQELQIRQIAAGANHMLAVTLTGQVYAWGDNEYG